MTYAFRFRSPTIAFQRAMTSFRPNTTLNVDP